MDTLKTDWLIMAASAAYIDLMGASEPEMVAYSTFYFAQYPEVPNLAEQIGDMARLPPAARKRACLRFLEYLKSENKRDK